MSEKLTLDEKILNAKRSFKPVLKNTPNPFLKTKYADLNTVIDAIEDSLSQNGLDYYQSVDGTDTITVIPGVKPGEETVIVSGQSLVTVITDGVSSRKTIYPLLLKLDKNKAEQSLGAAHTYSRRQGLLAAFGLRAEDNDGEGTKKATPPASSKPASQPQQTTAKPTPASTTTKPAPAATQTASKPAAASAPASGKTLDDIKGVSGVIVTETEDSITVSGQTYSLSNDLKSLGFTWVVNEKAWRKKVEKAA